MLEETRGDSLEGMPWADNPACGQLKQKFINVPLYVYHSRPVQADSYTWFQFWLIDQINAEDYMRLSYPH